MNHGNAKCRALSAGCVLLTSLASACGFSAPNPWLPAPEQIHKAMYAAPLLPLADSSRYTVMEKPGKMKLMHGRSCANPERAAGKQHIGFRVHEWVEMPAGYTGAVYLNGFRGDYEDGDRNFLGLGAMINSVYPDTANGELHWEAGGVLGDNSGDDAYRWCYWYAIVMWNPAAAELDIAAFQDDANAARTTFSHPEDFDVGNDTALRDLPGKYADDFRREPKAIVPRGFGLLYGDGDANLLQAGFDLGIAKPNGTKLEWNSQTVLKDNDKQRPYHGAATVSVLLGDSVHVWEPEKALVHQSTSAPGAWEQVSLKGFQLEPRDSAQACLTDDIDYRTYEYVVEDVPFDYALPVLRGWDNGNFCSDTNVASTGVWITEVYYDKQPGGLGKLKYTVASVFSDGGGWNGSIGNLTHHGVVILGFNELSGTGESLPKVPQEIPQEISLTPGGTSPSLAQ